MNGQLILSYPIWFSLLCLLFGGAAAGWLYHRDKLLAEYNILLKSALFLFRTLLIATLAFLLLGPVWKGVVTRTEKPMIIFLEDNSESVSEFTDPVELEAYRQQRDKMLASLERDYEVERYRFGSDLYPWNDSLPGHNKSTDLALSLKHVEENHSMMQVGAVILASDGIYNKGYNPSYASLSAGTSIYTIALGDTTSPRDMFVQSLQYPKVVYLGDKFQLDIDWGATRMKGVEASLRVTDDRGSVVLQKDLSIDKDEVFGKESVIIDADRPGINVFRVQLSGSADDVPANNGQSAHVEVLDGRKQVLILYDGPHPDVKAIKAVLEKNRNYEVEVSSARDFQGSTDNYDLVIFHGLPSIQPGGDITPLARKIISKGQSVAFIVSIGTDLERLNNLQPVVNINASGQAPNNVMGMVNRDFTDFNFPEGMSVMLANTPPMVCPFGDYTTGPSTKTILFQRLGDINTGDPLVAAGNDGTSHILVITGEGLWRWRMSEFAREEQTGTFDEWMSSLVQYVTVREDKRKFRLFVNRNLYWENENILFHAELYNANYELINEPDVTMTIRDSEGQAYDFAFDRSVNAYRLNAGILPVGNYSADAEVTWGGDKYTAQVRFTIREVMLETLSRQADHNLLYGLSESTGGKMYPGNEFGGMEEEIRSNINLKPVIYDSVRTTSLLQFKWIFFILLALVSIEWFIRKWLGGF